MPRPKRTESAALANQTRQQLLDAATDAFARDGYTGANVNTISREAGFAKGTIYNYFPSKRDLMLAVLTAAADAHCAALAERALAEATAPARLTAFFQAGFDFVAANLPQARVALATVHGHDAGFKQHLWTAYQPMFELMARDILGFGIAQGDFRPCDPAATTNLILTTYLGAGSQVTDDGTFWLDPGNVAGFILRALAAEPQA